MFRSKKVEEISKCCRTLEEDKRAPLVELCGDYYDAIVFTLAFLFDEKRKGHVCNEKINKIICGSFGFAERYAHEIVQCYLGNRNMTQVKGRKTKDFNFSPSMMDSLCKENSSKLKKDGSIIIPQDIKDEILRLSNATLKVSDIMGATMNRNGCFIYNNIQISKSLRNSIESQIAKFDPAFDVLPDLQYWRLFFKYLLPLISIGLVRNDTMHFSTLDAEYILKLLQAIEKSYPYKSADFFNESIKYMAPLLQYANELETLGKNTGKYISQQEKIDIFSEVRVSEFSTYSFFIPYIKKIAEFRLRPADVRLMYYIGVLYDYESAERFFDENIYEKLYDYFSW